MEQVWPITSFNKLLGEGVAHNQLRQTLGEGVAHNQLRQTFGRRLEEHKGIFHQNSSNSLGHLDYLYTYYTTF